MTWPNPTRAAALILLTTAAIAGCGGVTTSVPEPSFPAAKRAALDAALTKAMAERKVPGVVVGLWIPGEGTYVVTRGVSELATGKAKTKYNYRCSEDGFRFQSRLEPDAVVCPKCRSSDIEEVSDSPVREEDN